MGLIRKKTAAGKALDAALKEAGTIECRVGWFETAKYENGTPVAYVAAIQEHGVPARSIPARPFMRPTVQREKPNWDALISNGATQVLEGKTGIQTVMETLGLIASGDVRKTISQVSDPPLSLTTLLLRKYKKKNGAGSVTSAKQVAEAYHNANMQGPRRKSDKTLSVTGVSTKPLIDSSIMFNTLTYSVTRKEHKK